MTPVFNNIFKSWLVCLCCAMFASGPALRAQPAAPEEPSKIDLMVQVVLSSDTPLDLRRETVRTLLQDSQAHPALLSVLSSDNNIDARIIVCQAIAGLNVKYLGLEETSRLPLTFIEPLCQALLSDNNELASTAARALVKCHNGVADRLAKIVADPAQSPSHRMAFISALELIPGKQPVLAVAAALNDKDPDIQKRAAQALAKMLYLPSLDIDQFLREYLPRLRNLDRESFLSWQNNRRKAQIRDLDNHLQDIRDESQYWRELYLNSQMEWFRRLAKPEEKLDFLKPFLIDQPKESLRLWAVQRITDWSESASVGNGPVSQPLVDILSQLIADSNPQVRQLTAMALAKLNFEKARLTAPALLEQLNKESVPQTQEALLAALGTLEHVPAMEKILEMIDASTSPKVVAAAAGAVGKICAARSQNVTSEQMEQIASRLARSYQKWSLSTELRSDLIQTIRRIAEQKKYHPQAIKYFEDLLISNALNDPEPTIRSRAVYALTLLLDEQVLELLLKDPRNLLDDEEISVRYAVIAAIEKFGGSSQLNLLRRCLAKESDSEIAQLIINAFTKTLDSLSLEEVYQWALQLQNASDKEQTLRREAVRILWDKFSKAKAESEKPGAAIERFALCQLAEIAERNNQPEQAAKWYRQLLKLPRPEDQKAKDIYREKIILLALIHNSDEILRAAEPLAADLLKNRPDLLEKIAQTCDLLDPLDNEKLLRRAKIVAALIAPLTEYPSEQSRQNWRQRITNITLALIESQEKLLTETGRENPDVITLLPRLEPKLTGYPSPQAPVDQRREALKQFRVIVQPSKPEAPTPPADKTPSEPNDQPPADNQKEPTTEPPGKTTPPPGQKPDSADKSEKTP